MKTAGRFMGREGGQMETSQSHSYRPCAAIFRSMKVAVLDGLDKLVYETADSKLRICFYSQPSMHEQIGDSSHTPANSVLRQNWSGRSRSRRL